MRRGDLAIAAIVAVAAVGQALGSGLIAFQYDWSIPHSASLLRDWSFQEWSVPQRAGSGDWAPYPFEIYVRSIFGLFALAGFDGDQVQKLFIAACALMTAIGIVALGRAFGQPAWKSAIVALSLLASSTLYNALALGYVTFLFSSAVLVLLLNAALRYFRTGDRSALAWMLLLTPFTWAQVQIGLFSIVAIVVLACFAAVERRRPLIAVALVVAYSAVAFAFVWVPFLLGYSRSGLPTANQSWVTLTAPTLYQLLGDLPQDYPLHAAALGRLLLPFAWLSALVALTALYNLRLAPRSRRLALAAIVLAVAFGAVFLQPGPALELRLSLWNAIPGVAIVRNPAYFVYAFWFLVLLVLCITADDRQTLLLGALCACACVPLWNGSDATTLQHVAVTREDEVALPRRSLVLPRPEPFAFKGSAAPGLSILAAPDALPAFINDQALPSYEASLLAQLVDRGDSADVFDGLMRLGGLQDALVLNSLTSRFTTYVHAGRDPWLSDHVTNASLARRLTQHQLPLSRRRGYDRYAAREPGGETLRCSPVVAEGAGSIRAAAANAQAFADACVTADPGAGLRSDVWSAAEYGLHDRRDVPLFVPATAASTPTGIDANTGWAAVMSGQWWWFDGRADAFAGTLFSKTQRTLAWSIRPPVDGTFFVRVLRWPGGPSLVDWTDTAARTGGVGYVGTANAGNFADIPLGRARGGRTTQLELRFDGGLVAVAGVGVVVRPAAQRPPDLLVLPDCDGRCVFDVPPHGAPLAIRLVGSPAFEPVRYRWAVSASGARLLAAPTGIAVRDGDRVLAPREEVVARIGTVPLVSSAVGTVAVPVSGAGVAGLLDAASGTVSVTGKGWTAVRSLTAPRRWYVAVPPEPRRRRIVVTNGTAAARIGKYDWVFGDFTSADPGAASGAGRLTALGTAFTSSGVHVFGVHSQRVHLTQGHYRAHVTTAACRGGPYEAKVWDERSSTALGAEETACGRDFEVPFDVATTADVRVYVESTGASVRGGITVGDAVLREGNPYGVVASLRTTLPPSFGIQRNVQYRSGARLTSRPGAVPVPSVSGMLLWAGAGPAAGTAWDLPAAELYRNLLVLSAACEALLAAYLAGAASLAFRTTLRRGRRRAAASQ